jgi:hypothetical protein
LVGVFNGRIDFQLLEYTIKQTPSVSFILIGPVDENFPENRSCLIAKRIQQLRQYPNVYCIDSVPRKHIPSYIRAFDTAFIPYDINIPFNQRCFPLKTMEFFYFGIPVIATPMKSLLPLKPLVRIITTAHEASEAIGNIKPNTLLAKKRHIMAIQNSWENKISKMIRIIHNQNFFSKKSI